MPKPQSRKNPDTRSKDDPSRRNTGHPGGPRIIPAEELADIPIRDPFAEKQLMERGGSLRSLSAVAVTYSRESLHARIVELYRRCYEESAASKQQKVIGDFVASFPDLIFEASWLAKLVKWEVATRDYRLLRALAGGFRRAAEPGPRLNRSWRDTRVGAARSFRTTLQSELSQWGRGWERKIPTREWIDEQATEKATELVGTYPCLKPHKQRLQRLLSQGKYYDASVFMAGKVFRIRERDLQRGLKVRARPVAFSPEN